ncbi:hypothetical protein JAAARDRAFT_475680 [Jaapia argillacea MUCL 33604]|uniref:Uncharacterized protein n=1 Tax=Jaapia argillacea MUCL 33604 TaxID=933084 RepID=A0A067PQZ1_9AGAM|nr:hypothetical protein JAAARDRAFT_475680 [Jaapia argillacea MUCL 33604]
MSTVVHLYVHRCESSSSRLILWNPEIGVESRPVCTGAVMGIGWEVLPSSKPFLRTTTREEAVANILTWAAKVSDMNSHRHLHHTFRSNRQFQVREAPCVTKMPPNQLHRDLIRSQGICPRGVSTAEHLGRLPIYPCP